MEPAGDMDEDTIRTIGDMDALELGLTVPKARTDATDTEAEAVMEAVTAIVMEAATEAGMEILTAAMEEAVTDAAATVAVTAEEEAMEEDTKALSLIRHSLA